MKIENYIQKYLERTLLYRTVGTYQYYLKVSRAILKALKFCNIIEIKDLNEEAQESILVYYKTKTKKKNSQINSDISFFYTVVNYYNLPHKLTPFVKLRDDTTPFRVIDDTTLRELIKWIKELDNEVSNNLSWSLSVLLSLETGVRMNELLNIKTDNVDLETKTILLETTKSGKKRVLFFDVLSFDLISKVKQKKTEYLIWNYNKNCKMKRAGLFYFYNLIDSGLNPAFKITSHRLRKTFATKLLKSGCPITTIQKLLGHSDIRMTMKYLEIDKAMIEKDYFIYYPYKDLA